ncbi:hypothetical protein OIO90_003640 [Microbotryomycetes sp. JL221]|nr:hypothetical protein OIO90_003640 [Microbotryomycetes sp. JL221]
MTSTSTLTHSGRPVAFLGATGGCTFACLVRTLTAGIECRALVRTPSKLWDMLKSRKELDQTKIVTLLTIVQGDAKDPDAVKQLLSVEPRLIVFGIGGTPSFQWSLTTPITLTDPTICADSMKTLLQVISQIPTIEPLTISVISTTGISSTTQDVPGMMKPLYKYGLHIPHQDKQEMERLLTCFSLKKLNWIIVRPSLLTDSTPVKPQSSCPTQKVKPIKVGWEGSTQGPAVGYSISRDDVGKWLFETLIEPTTVTQHGHVNSEWFGRKVSITH